MEAPEITVLENGLTVVTQVMPTLQTYANISFGVGSRNEEHAKPGISHYLEHMLASDTEELDKDEKVLRIRNMRGSSNAGTGFESTSYYIRASNKHSDEALRILADGILRPRMAPTRIEKERGAITSEVQGKLSDPDRIELLLMLETAFPGSPLSQNISGSPESVATITREDLIAYKDQFYTSDNAILTVVGDVDHDEICQKALELFADLPHTPNDVDLAAPPAHYRGGYKLREGADMQQIHFSMTFEGSPASDLRASALNTLLGPILGGDQSSRLMKNLRGEKGLVYYAQAGAIPFATEGLFNISAGFHANQAQEATFAICDELVRASQDITQEELDSARNQIIGAMERGMESVENVAYGLESSVRSIRKVRPFEEKIALFESITIEDLKAHAAKIFSTAPSVTAYGKDVAQIPSYEEITERLGKRRELDESGHAKDTAPSADVSIASVEVVGATKATRQRAVG